MMNRAVCLSILTLGIAAAFTSVSSEPAAAESCVDFSRNPGRFINNCGRRVVVRWTDEFACQNNGGCSITLRAGETQVVASSRGRVSWSAE
ncbi:MULTISPECIES: hypothetical protein [Bradyrhizobium]|jgi:hypothetical protein|uniref:DUF3551 domain-containing protein n=3 Tax=Bradyrhizobium TaxID=374 RepID=A0ABY0PQV6_9BRAD|nr:MULTISPECIES: hypothetical protein [Bradyrhizobium]SDI81439.1 hypothetical protein SAMN05444163_3796 [Bradyrhizobium ottawaense]SED18136.1 hypothetical protein SAMN05444171_3368 [Bradyrhizobium lablabi]SHL22394.1 hypothetical protein SAMN05444321_2205 [Bradyrhizobium lablabi]